MGSLAVRMCSLLSRRAAVACQNRAALPIGAIAGPQALLDRLYSNYAASSSDPHPHKHAFEEQEHTCWSCSDHFKRGGLICRSCDKIQPVDSALTYYDLLGYKAPTFDIDPCVLEKRYKLLQWQLHPDKVVTRTTEEQAYSADHASLINQAYGVLRTPLSRANYMLMLKGLEASEGTIEDPELLMEVMEAREEVEGTDDPESLQRLSVANQRRQDALVQQIAGAFREGADQQAAALTQQLTYLVRIQQAIMHKL